MRARYYAVVEAGGTKFNCALMDDQGHSLKTLRIPTTNPSETLSAVYAFFSEASRDVSALGIASFGPVDVNPKSNSYGKILSTPKPGWRGVEILNHLTKALGVRGCIETDVNAAALGEYVYGSAKGSRSICYVTVGTGIGVGILLDGKPFPGRHHSEAGHMRVLRAPEDNFEGICPFHKDCLEGLASGPAIQERWGQPAEQLSDDHRAWDFQAHYIAMLCNNLLYTLRPDCIVIGGGVFEKSHLIGKVRTQLQQTLAGYGLDKSELDMENFVRTPSCNQTPSAMLGALELAKLV